MIHMCTRMGYMWLVYEDGTTHLQPFLVNSAAADCILSPDAIVRQSTDCVTWRQVGHVGDRPGTLAFFNELGQGVMRLQFLKTNGLYYADIQDVHAPGADTQSVYNMFIEDWIQVLDAERPEDELVRSRLQIASTPVIKPITNKVTTRRNVTPPQLPTLIEDE